MSIDTSSYKAALDTGDRAKIVAEAIALVKSAGGTPKDPRATNVSASKGNDNSKETARFQKTFNDQALGFTNSADGYNKRLNAGGAAQAELGVMVDQLQDLATAHANLTEIERIEAGKGPGAGGGLPGQGGGAAGNLVAMLEALQRDVTAIKTKLGI